MCRDRRDDWEAHDHIEDAKLNCSETSSDEFLNATNYATNPKIELC